MQGSARTHRRRHTGTHALTRPHARTHACPHPARPYAPKGASAETTKSTRGLVTHMSQVPCRRCCCHGRGTAATVMVVLVVVVVVVVVVVRAAYECVSCSCTCAHAHAHKFRPCQSKHLAMVAYGVNRHTALSLELNAYCMETDTCSKGGPLPAPTLGAGCNVARCRQLHLNCVCHWRIEKNWREDPESTRTR